MNDKQAYATDDPAILAAYRESRAARSAFSSKLLADAAAIGHNRGPLVRHDPETAREEIVGLKPDGSGIVPAGWRLAGRGSSQRLAPDTTSKGDKARAWLVAHQPPAGSTPLHVLLDHGLVALSRVERGAQPGDNYQDFSPHLFEWDDTLWACYRGTPLTTGGREVTWPAVPLDTCLTALARFEGAAAAPLN